MINNNIDHAAKRAEYEMKFMDENDVFQTLVLDFDGTCVTHRYPNVGTDAPHCVETLKRWIQDYGVGIILSTMRDGKTLEDAVNWFKERNIPLYGIQKHPTQEEWTTSPKAHGRYNLDDRNVGTPLTLDNEGYPIVDWKETVRIFEPTLKAVHEKIRYYEQNKKKSN